MRLLQLFPVFLLLGSVSAFAGTVYDISVDTRSLPGGTSGFIDLAFNGGFPATATISNFSAPGASLAPATIFTQDATGALPAIVTMDENNSDYDEGLTFASSIVFDLSLSETPGGATGDVLTLSFFNSDFSGSLLTGNINDGWLAQFQLDTNGRITPTAYANPTGGASYATITTVTPTPEPGTAIIFGLALPALAAIASLRRARRRHNPLQPEINA